MNTNAFFSCVNAASMLTHCLTVNNLSFLDPFLSSEASLSLPAGNDGLNIYLLNSPYVYEVEEGYKGSFFLVCYRIWKNQQTLYGARMDITFDEHCKIRSAVYSEMLSLVPQVLNAEDVKGFRLEEDWRMWSLKENGLTAEDYISLQQIVSRQIHESLILERESFQMLFSPVYRGSSEGALLNAYSLKFLLDGKEDCYNLSLASVQYRFSKEEGKWSLAERSELASVPLCPLGANPNVPPQAKEMIERKFSERLKLDASLDISADDYAEILDQAAQWVGAIRSCDPSNFISEALDLEAEDLMVDVVVPVSGMAGFTEQFGMMKRMKELQPKCQGVHTLSTPYMETDNSIVTVYFQDFGWTMMGGAFGNQGKICSALPDVGRYIMKFRKRESGWKLFSLNWGPAIQYGMWQFDRELSIGWAHEDDDSSWPGIK